MITGTIAFLGFVYPTSKLLQNTYYQIKNPRRLKILYKWLGVEYFRMILLKTLYIDEDNKRYFNGIKSGVLLFDYNTKQSEFGHIIAFFLVLLISIFLLLRGQKCVFCGYNL